VTYSSSDGTPSAVRSRPARPGTLGVVGGQAPDHAVIGEGRRTGGRASPVSQSRVASTFGPIGREDQVFPSGNRPCEMVVRLVGGKYGRAARRSCGPLPGFSCVFAALILAGPQADLAGEIAGRLAEPFPARPPANRPCARSPACGSSHGRCRPGSAFRQFGKGGIAEENAALQELHGHRMESRSPPGLRRAAERAGTGTAR